MQKIKAKLVMLGIQDVGKTSIAIRYVDKVFQKRINSTIGATYFPCTITVDDFKISVEIWDTAGQERYKAMAPLFYRNSDAAFLVFDISNSSSFEGVKVWVDELRCKVEEKIAMCIIGNKNDLSESREVTFNDANSYAQSVGADYIEASALTNEGISEAFDLIAKRIVERHKILENCKSRNYNLDTIQVQKTDNFDENPKSSFCC